MSLLDILVEECDSMSTEPQSDTSTKTSKFQDHLLVAIGDLEQSGDHVHGMPHGLAIKTEIEDSDYGPSKINHSRLYHNLGTITDLGLA